MRRRFSTRDFVIFGLIAIGILGSIISNPSGWIIPIVVFGGIFLLYKFPPGKYQKNRKYQSSTAQKKQKQRKEKKASFRVIRGNKSDENEDETPKYH